MKLLRKCVTNIIKNAVQRIQFISLKTHAKGPILILRYLYTWLQLNQMYSAVRNQQWVTVPAFSGTLRKADPMGPGQRRTLKQAIRRAMKDEEVNKMTRKKFKRQKIKLCSAIRAFALALFPLIPLSSLPFLFPFSFTKTVPV